MGETMGADAAALPADPWFDWIAHGRHGGSTDYAREMRRRTLAFADRVLDAAGLAPGMTLVDVGSGDGLVAFRAIERVGPSLQVCLCDLSGNLLRESEARARQLGIDRQCTFVEASAERLDGLADASADVVTTRSVLAYVGGKLAALREFYRVLRPGGVLSIAEPVFWDDAINALALRRLRDAPPPGGEARLTALMHRWQAAQFPDTQEGIAQDPMTNYSERDLFQLAQLAGFTGLHLELHIDRVSCTGLSWQTFLRIVPHPLAPSLATIMQTQFAADERAYFEQTFRPVVEAGQHAFIERLAYLSARKPAAYRPLPASTQVARYSS